MNNRESLARKLTAMNMLVSGGALLLASVAFLAFELVAFRQNLITNTSIEAQIIGSNAVSPLIFNDPNSAQNTLSALRASPHIVYAGIYTPDGRFFAGYWSGRPGAAVPLPSFEAGRNETYWFDSGQFSLIQNIAFKDKLAGVVYIKSDLGALYDRLQSYAFILLVILAASLLAALALSRGSQRAVSEPILNLADTARLVSREKDYSVRARMTPSYDEVAGLAAAFNEMLSEIQRRDSALQESEQQFRVLADSIAQLAWMAEPDGTIFWYNQRWYEYTGTTLDEMMGWGWQSVHDQKFLPQVLQKWKAALAAGQPFEMIFPLRGADGTFRDFLTRALPVRDSQGKVVRWFGTNTDITEQRRAEEALRQTEKLAATGRLAASIAHEINNPLETVTNLVYLARKQPANSERYLNLADHELDRIAQITKNTLGFYRDTASPSEVSISEVLEEVLALFSRKLQFKKITLKLEQGDGFKITGFPGEVRQIFANLVANAIDALEDNGMLTIRASKVHQGNGLLQCGIRVTFLDNGIGITAANQKRIFEPFFTTKKDIGTGLGLWLTKGLVEKHRGSLHMRSSTKPGNTWAAFSVFLPVSPFTE